MRNEPDFNQSGPTHRNHTCPLTNQGRLRGGYFKPWIGRKLFLLIGALIIAIGTAFAARSNLRPEAEPLQPKPRPSRPAHGCWWPKARAYLRTIITVDALGFQPWPEELVKDAYFIDGEADMEQLLGTVVRFPITAGEPVTQGSLVAPGDRGFLAAALGPGMRAVTVPVSAMTGVAGFVFPGRPGRSGAYTKRRWRRPAAQDCGKPCCATCACWRPTKTTETTTDENGKTVVSAFPHRHARW